MITADNFPQLLASLGFTEANNIYSKHFNVVDCDLKVDFEKQELIYPEDKGFAINERQTCNFKAAENFVVFECVCRLLEKGYQPKDIELEPKWKLGHGASGGRADVWVRTKSRDQDGNETKQSLLIIECKTAGSEFTGAWNDTLEDGAQCLAIFSKSKRQNFSVCMQAILWITKQSAIII